MGPGRTNRLKQVEHDPFASGDVDTYVEATAAQRELWTSSQLGDDAACVFNQSVSVELVGELDLAALRHAFQDLVHRRDALRGTFSADGMLFLIASSVPCGIPLIDLSERSEADCTVELARLIDEDLTRPFDLSRGPLVRAKIVRTAARRHVLLLNVHHVVADGWSVNCIVRELGALYGARLSGASDPLPTPRTFVDYARGQLAPSRRREAESSEAYWEQQFSDDLPLLDIPFDRALPAVRSYRSHRVRRTVDAELIEKVRAVGAQRSCTLFGTLLASWAAFLARLTGQGDLVVGIPAAEQLMLGDDAPVGHLTNVLPLRLRFDGEVAFGELMNQARSMILDGIQHQSATFEHVIHRIAGRWDRRRAPLISNVFDVRPALRDIAFADLDVTFRWNDRKFESFELFMSVVEADGSWELELAHNPDLIELETAERWMDHFEVLLRSIAAGSEQAVFTLPLLSQAVERRMLHEWNRTKTDYPRDRALHDLFEEQVARAPTAVAVKAAGESGGELTYEELNSLADAVAEHLISAEVRAGTLVGVYMERSPDLIAAVLGVLKAGGAYVPLDPAYPHDRLMAMAEDAGLSLIVTQRACIESLDWFSGAVVTVEDAASDRRTKSVAVPVDAGDLAYVMYTSGSTGTPKGVCVTHRNVVRLVKNSTFASLDAGQVLLHFAPISFDASTFEVWGALLNGARLVVYPAGKPSLEELGQVIREEKVTTLWLTADLFRLMVDHRLDDLRNVRQLLAGGDVLPVPQVARFLSEVEECELINGYGPTENTTFTCCHKVTAGEFGVGGVPIGRPVSNTTVYVLDGRMQAVPVGVWGELWTGGDGVARGYLNRPELTAERFVPDPFSDDLQARLYRSGDIVRYRPDGSVEFRGRRDGQVKIRGFRIELGDVEAALRSSPAVDDGVVQVQVDGDDQKWLIGYWVPSHGSETSEQDLRLWLRARLPEFMIPQRLVQLECLPLSPNGKIDRGALPPVNLASTVRSGESVLEPSAESDLNKWLVGVWSDLLKLESIALDSDFFGLGGHSLLATRLSTRIRDERGIKCPLRVIFERPVLRDLAHWLEEKEETAAREAANREVDYV